MFTAALVLITTIFTHLLVLVTSRGCTIDSVSADACPPLQIASDCCIWKP